MRKIRYLSFLLAVCMLVPLIGVTGAPIQAAPEQETDTPEVPANPEAGTDEPILDAQPVFPMQGPLVLQNLNYTENPVDIPNPDRGPYRGRWQRVDTPFGMTPEVDHRVPVSETDVLYHGATLVGPGIIGTVEGDDIERTEFYNSTSQVPNYVGGTGVSALPGVSFMTFDLCNFSSNAFLSRQASYDFFDERAATGALNFEGRTGKTQPLTPYALNYIRSLLQKVRDGEGVAFVKFSYDGNGFNYLESWTGYREQLIYGPEPNFLTPNNANIMCTVPGHEDKDWIQYHIWQLKPIFEEFEDVIMCVKTGMFGPWGEQHSSTVARTRAEYKKLIDAYLDAVPDSRMLLTHVGGFMAWYNLTYNTSYTFTNIDTMPAPQKGSPEARIGFFDDSYAANWDDNGSMSETGGSSGTYNRYRNLNLIKKQNSMYQGEGGIGNNLYGNMPGAIIEAFEYRTTVLNMRHGAYNRWNSFIYTEAAVSAPVTFPASSSQSAPYTGPTKQAYFDPVYNGKTGLEYMRDRLGYRLLLREANASQWVEQGGVLDFKGKVQNVGFGNIVNQKKVSVILKNKANSDFFTVATDIDARDWLTAENGNTRADNTAAWHDLDFSIDLSEFGKIPAGEYDIYLKLNDPKETSANRRCIQFANYDIWNAQLGANKIGSTTVKEAVEPVLSDDIIKVVVDDSMSMQVFRNDGTQSAPVWVPMTKPITAMGAGGASATGVTGAWANALPWSASTGTGTNNFQAESAKVLSAKSSYVTTGAPYRVAESGRTTGLPTGAGTDYGETLLSDNFVVESCVRESNVKTAFSDGATGSRLTVVGIDSTLGLKHTLVLETGAVPGTIAVSSYYTYLGAGSLTVSKFVDNNFKIEDVALEKLIMNDERGNPDTKRPEAGLWSWQGCDVSSTQIEHTVAPVLDTMGTMSYGNTIHSTGAGHTMSRNNWNWTVRAGVAYNYFWGRNIGLGVGSLMPYHVYGLEMPVRGSGISGNSNIGYTWIGWPGKTLVSGEETYIGTSLVGVADGDFGVGNNMYGRAMDNVDITPFVDRGEFIARTDVNSAVTPWSFVVDGKNYATPRYEYKYAESTADYKGVPKDLIALPKGDEIADWALDPIWETWGYGQSMAPRALFYLIPVIARLGYGSVTYDAYWYSHGGPGADPIYMPKYDGQSGVSGTECDWSLVAPLLEQYFAENPHSKHKTAGDAYDFSNLNTSNQSQAIRCVRAMNEYIHEHGMHAIAWAQDSLVLASAYNSGRVPDSWRVKNYAGATVSNEACTGNPEFINTATTYISELIFGTATGEYAFDGYKGDTILGISPCYAEGHGHDGDPYAPMRNYGLFYKNLYDKANYLRGATEYVGGAIIDVNKMAAVKQCFCGRVMDYYSYAGVNRPIWGDHNGTKVNRQGNKSFRGFYGWDVPMDSDHHDTDFRSNSATVGDFDYANSLGTGMIFASKTRFNLNVYENANAESSSVMNFPGASNYNQKTGLTGMMAGSIKWGSAVKYYGLYHDLSTTQTRMIGDLYKHVVDYPEAYALELMDKDPVTGKLSPKANSERIYSFYASSYPVESTDPYLRSTSGYRYYRELATGNSGGRIYDPWNSVYKDIPNTTNTITANTPFKFVYTGPIELRGLKANTTYCLTDVETGEKLTKVSDANGLIAFDATFVNSVIYHVVQAVTGSVSGKVYGADGNILPGATITLYNSANKKVFWDTASDMDGFYAFPLVPDGQYKLVATFPKGYVAPASGTAAVPNNDTRYTGFTPVNLDYFDNVIRYSATVEITGLAITKDIAPKDISISADYAIYLTEEPVPDGDYYNPGFTIVNKTDSTKSVSIFVALYDARGKMIDVATTEHNATVGYSSAQASIPKIATAATYRFFIWQDGYLPLTAITSLD